MVLALLIGFVFALSMITPVQAAEQACAPRASALNHLAKKYNEQPVAMGLANNGGVLEIISTAEGSTWTIILTMPNGVACMIATGESWSILPPPLKLGSKV